MEYLHSQVRAIRRAFGTLADVILEEIDAIRDEFTVVVQSQDAKHVKAMLEAQGRIDELEMVNKVQKKETRALRGEHKNMTKAWHPS